MAASQNIQVHVRVRGGQQGVGAVAGKALAIDPLFENRLRLRCPSNPYQGSETFTFDGVLLEHTEQRAVYDSCAAELVNSCLDGVHGTILAYGQTGSGKTHTIVGGSKLDDKGIIPRAAQQVYEELSRRMREGTVLEAVTTVQMLEVYRESVRDLLSTYHGPADSSTDPAASAGSSSKLRTVRDSLGKPLFLEEEEGDVIGTRAEDGSRRASVTSVGSVDSATSTSSSSSRLPPHTARPGSTTAAASAGATLPHAGKTHTAAPSAAMAATARAAAVALRGVGSDGRAGSGARPLPRALQRKGSASSIGSVESLGSLHSTGSAGTWGGSDAASSTAETSSCRGKTAAAGRDGGAGAAGSGSSGAFPHQQPFNANLAGTGAAAGGGRTTGPSLRVTGGGSSAGGKAGAGVAIQGAQTVLVSNSEEVLDCLAHGLATRVVSRTRCNDHSSRSHLIFCLCIESQLPGGEQRRAKLVLVDLAGSEAVLKSGVQGKELEEAKFINKSLSQLGICINALTSAAAAGAGAGGGAGLDQASSSAAAAGSSSSSSSRHVHIPYRDSKLTRLLEPALGGNSRTAIILTVSPDAADYEQTKSTLRFGVRAKEVKTRPMTNAFRTALSEAAAAAAAAAGQADMHALQKQQQAAVAAEMAVLKGKVLRLQMLLALAAQAAGAEGVDLHSLTSRFYAQEQQRLTRSKGDREGGSGREGGSAAAATAEEREGEEGAEEGEEEGTAPPSLPHLSLSPLLLKGAAAAATAAMPSRSESGNAAPATPTDRIVRRKGKRGGHALAGAAVLWADDGEGDSSASTTAAATATAVVGAASSLCEGSEHASCRTARSRLPFAGMPTFSEIRAAVATPASKLHGLIADYQQQQEEEMVQEREEECVPGPLRAELHADSKGSAVEKSTASAAPVPRYLLDTASSSRRLYSKETAAAAADAPFVSTRKRAESHNLTHKAGAGVSGKALHSIHSTPMTVTISLAGAGKSASSVAAASSALTEVVQSTRQQEMWAGEGSPQAVAVPPSSADSLRDRRDAGESSPSPSISTHAASASLLSLFCCSEHGTEASADCTACIAARRYSMCAAPAAGEGACVNGDSPAELEPSFLTWYATPVKGEHEQEEGTEEARQEGGGSAQSLHPLSRQAMEALLQEEQLQMANLRMQLASLQVAMLQQGAAAEASSQQLQLIQQELQLKAAQERLQKEQLKAELQLKEAEISQAAADCSELRTFNEGLCKEREELLQKLEESREASKGHLQAAQGLQLELEEKEQLLESQEQQHQEELAALRAALEASKEEGHQALQAERTAAEVQLGSLRQQLLEQSQDLQGRKDMLSAVTEGLRAACQLPGQATAPAMPTASTGEAISVRSQQEALLGLLQCLEIKQRQHLLSYEAASMGRDRLTRREAAAAVAEQKQVQQRILQKLEQEVSKHTAGEAEWKDKCGLAMQDAAAEKRKVLQLQEQLVQQAEQCKSSLQQQREELQSRLEAVKKEKELLESASEDLRRSLSASIKDASLLQEQQQQELASAKQQAQAAQEESDAYQHQCRSMLLQLHTAEEQLQDVTAQLQAAREEASEYIETSAKLQKLLHQKMKEQKQLEEAVLDGQRKDSSRAAEMAFLRADRLTLQQQLKEASESLSAELSSLQGQAAVLRAEKETALVVVAAAETAAEEARQARDATQQEARAAVGMAEQKIQHLEAAAAEQLAALSGKLQEAEMHAAALQSQLAAVDVSLRKSQEQLKQRSAACIALAAALAVVRGKQLPVLQKALQEQQRQVTFLTETRDRQMAELAQLQALLATSSSNKQQLQEFLQSRTELLEAALQQKQALHAEISCLQLALVEQEKQGKAVAASLVHTEAQLEGERASKQTLQQELLQQQDRVQQLQQEKEETLLQMTQQKQEYEESKSDMCRQLSVMQQQLTTASAGQRVAGAVSLCLLRKLTSVRRELVQEGRVASEKQAELCLKLQELEAQMHCLRAEKAAVSKQMQEQLQAVEDELQCTKEEWEAEKALLEVQAKAWHQKATRAEEAEDASLKENTLLQAHKAELELQLGSLQASLSALKQDAQAATAAAALELQKALADAEKDKAAALTAERTASQAALADLQRQMWRLRVAMGAASAAAFSPVSQWEQLHKQDLQERLQRAQTAGRAAVEPELAALKVSQEKLQAALSLAEQARDAAIERARAATLALTASKEQQAALSGAGASSAAAAGVAAAGATGAAAPTFLSSFAAAASSGLSSVAASAIFYKKRLSDLESQMQAAQTLVRSLTEECSEEKRKNALLSGSLQRAEERSRGLLAELEQQQQQQRAAKAALLSSPPSAAASAALAEAQSLRERLASSELKVQLLEDELKRARLDLQDMSERFLERSAHGSATKTTGKLQQRKWEESGAASATTSSSASAGSSSLAKALFPSAGAAVATAASSTTARPQAVRDSENTPPAPPATPAGSGLSKASKGAGAAFTGSGRPTSSMAHAAAIMAGGGSIASGFMPASPFLSPAKLYARSMVTMHQHQLAQQQGSRK